MGKDEAMAATRNFSALLSQRWKNQLSVSVGLDVDPARLPTEYQSFPDPLEGVIAYHRDLIEVTAPLAAAYKPQVAGFEAMGSGGFETLQATIAAAHELAPDVPVILDAKHGDIGTTNEQYAKAAFDVLDADAITVAPYMGLETMAPYLDRSDRGVIILCRTSNPGAGRYQDLLVDGVPLFQHIAKDVVETWNRNGNCGLVVGATYPEELATVRALVGDLPILVPGIGAQGGDVEATVKAGTTAGGAGLLLHVSRSLIYAFENASVIPAAEAARLELERLNDQIVAARA